MANEIHLNNAGINSVETPEAPLQVQAGTSLRLKLINHGAPIHLTLSSTNASPFSEFSHQNLYVREQVIHEIPIREDAIPGTFEVTVITGYGTVRSSFRVMVVREPERPAEPSTQRPRYPTLAPEERSLPPVVLLFAGAGLVLYLVWWVTRLDVVNFAAFLLLMAGIIVGWVTQRP